MSSMFDTGKKHVRYAEAAKRAKTSVGLVMTCLWKSKRRSTAKKRPLTSPRDQVCKLQHDGEVSSQSHLHGPCRYTNAPRQPTQIACTSERKREKCATAALLPKQPFFVCITWGDVVRGAHRLLHVLVSREVLGEAEVDQLDGGGVPRRLHQPILQLQVAMDDAVAVHVAHLPHERA